MSCDETSVFVLLNNSCFALGLKAPSVSTGFDDVSFDGLSVSSSTPTCTSQHVSIVKAENSVSDGSTVISTRDESMGWFESTFKTISQCDSSELGALVDPAMVLPKMEKPIEGVGLKDVTLVKKKQKTEVQCKRSKPVEECLNDVKYEKPRSSYSCLIGLALKNSRYGCLPVSTIYKFLSENFPYFQSAPSSWKNTIRHNLSLNRCFEKLEKPGNGVLTRKKYYWTIHPSKKFKLDQEIMKFCKQDPSEAKKCMAFPEKLQKMGKGELRLEYAEKEVEEAQIVISQTQTCQLVKPNVIFVHKIGIPPCRRKS